MRWWAEKRRTGHTLQRNLAQAFRTCISENFLRSIWNRSRSSPVSPDSHTATIGIFTDAKLRNGRKTRQPCKESRQSGISQV